MKIKTTILLITAAIGLYGCAQRSYVMSFRPSTGEGYALPNSLAPESTTPSEVAKPEAPTTAKKINKPTRGDDTALQATNDSSIEGDSNVEEVEASGTFVGNETEHVRFTNYNPFTAGALNIDLDAAASNFTYPIDGKFSSGYGRRGRGTHAGVDLVAPALTPIYAVFDGVVRLSKPYSGYGNVIVVRHDNGLETVYAHNTKNLVRPGQKVSSGEVIAKCGRTGRATTEHLHFEVRIQGQTVNPKLLIDVDNKRLQGGVLQVTKNSSGIVTARLSGGAAGSGAVTYASATKVEQATEKVVEKVEQAEKVVEKTEKTEKTEKVASRPLPPVSPSQSRGIRVGDKVYDAPTNPAQWHSIVSGDTISTIARKYSTTTAEICRLNSITKDTVIKIGKKIRVK